MKKSIFLLTLGCAKNKVDSERVVAELQRRGFYVTNNPDEAQIGLLNTCGFIRSAVQESIDAILSLLEYKEKEKMEKIVVFGCLLNRYGDELKKELPEVDVWAESEDIMTLLEGLNEPPCTTEVGGRALLPGGTALTRYVKIIEGCDNHCTYCTIPTIRGRARSLSVNAIVKEAHALVESGARELCLVGQDLTAYGLDLSGKAQLIELLDALETSLPKDVWLRLLYLHPNRVTSKLLERVALGQQVLPYLDIPIQHASSRILSAMNRNIEMGSLAKIFNLARNIRSDFGLRTTCLLGFPGETPEDFETLLEFLKTVEFDRVGAFTFFPEEGTPAAVMENQVAKRTKENRFKKLMHLQAEISHKRQEMFLGKQLNVLVERIFDDSMVAEARSFREAPEVDGIIEVRDVRNDLVVGDFITVQIEEAMEHDLVAVEVKSAR